MTPPANASRPLKPRVAPLPVAAMGDAERVAMAAMGASAAERFLSGAPDGPPLPNVLGLLMHHPRLAGPWLTYNNVLLRDPTIDPRHRELMIIRVAWRARSSYELIQHIRLGERLGITAEEVDALTRGLDSGDASRWTPLERALLAATDQLVDRFCIDDDTWARLAAHFSTRELLELTFVVGSYVCLAMAFNTFGLELDADLDPNSAPAFPPEAG